LAGSWQAAPPTGVPYSFTWLASDGRSVIYALRRNQVEKYDLQGHLLGRWGPSGAGATNLVDIAVDAGGSVFVADSSVDGAVYKFSADGQVLANWPAKLPSGVAPASDGTVYVSAAEGIDRYSASGALLSHWPFADTTVKQVTLARDGRLFVIFTGGESGRVGVINSNGGISTAWGGFSRAGPEDLAVDSRGVLWVSDPYESHIVRLDAEGRRLGPCGPTEVFVRAPWGLAAVGRDMWTGSIERMERIAEVQPPAPACDGHPHVAKLRASPRSFPQTPPAARRTTFSFIASDQGRAVIALSRMTTVACGRASQTRCDRLIRVGTITAPARSGRNRVRFTGRLAGRVLPRGRYHVRLTITSLTRRRSRPATTSFRVS
jgi:streptogramin lyase